jgi:hypothetical protein
MANKKQDSRVQDVNGLKKPVEEKKESAKK